MSEEAQSNCDADKLAEEAQGIDEPQLEAVKAPNNPAQVMARGVTIHSKLKQALTSSDFSVDQTHHQLKVRPDRLRLQPK